MPRILRQYGFSTTVIFNLHDATTDDLETAATFATGDIQISQDEGSFTNATNSPTHEGNGVYSLILTAGEMGAARIAISLIDSAVKVWKDKTVFIETYGNASAQHAFDLNNASVNVASMDSDVIGQSQLTNGAISSAELDQSAVNFIRDEILDRVLPGNHNTANTPGYYLQQLPSGVADQVWEEVVSDHDTQGTFGGLYREMFIDGYVNDPTPTTTAFQLSGTFDGIHNSIYVGMDLLFLSGPNKGIKRTITSYKASCRLCQFTSAFPAIPNNGDELRILGCCVCNTSAT